MQAFWFGIIAVLWAGFFVLEGFDFGVGMVLPIVGRTDEERATAISTIGPVWDGNEVWLLVAGGATFAAFPEWYASLFSGFYLAFALLLVGLILRGISIEYRGKAATAGGRKWCDAGIVVGSAVPALLVGVAFANFVRGVQMNSAHQITGGFFALLNPYALLGGLVTLSLFAFHGAVFLTLRTEGAVKDKAQDTAETFGPVATVLAALFMLWSLWVNASVVSVITSAAIVVAVTLGWLLARNNASGRSFTATALATLLMPVWAFASMWPNVLLARNVKAFSLTVHNASSSHYTLTVMTVVALLFTPIVLAYQGWAYWVFRGRVTGGHGEYGSAVTNVVTKAKQSAQTMLDGGAAGESAPPAPAHSQ
jgi:cytochrome d ubiquinol oxidase subunit II